MRIGISYWSKDDREQLAVHAFADKGLDVLGLIDVQSQKGRTTVEGSAMGVEGGRPALLEIAAQQFERLAAQCRAGFPQPAKEPPAKP